MKSFLVGVLEFTVTIAAAIAVYVFVEADFSARVALTLLTYLAMVTHFNTSHHSSTLDNAIINLQEDLNAKQISIEQCESDIQELKEENETLRALLSNAEENDQ